MSAKIISSSVFALCRIKNCRCKCTIIAANIGLLRKGRQRLLWTIKFLRLRPILRFLSRLNKNIVLQMKRTLRLFLSKFKQGILWTKATSCVLKTHTVGFTFLYSKIKSTFSHILFGCSSCCINWIELTKK